MSTQSILKTLFIAGILSITACQFGKENAVINVQQNGEMRVFGKPAADLETLKTMLVDSLLNMSVLPEKIEVSFEGEVGMGMRQEVETIASEALEAAKLLQQAPKVEIKLFAMLQGTDCDKDEAERTDCARINLLYPVVIKGEKALQDAVTQWTNAYLFGILENPEADIKSKSLEEAANAFFRNHEAYKKEAGKSAMAGAFEANTGADVVFNNGKYLTLAINGNAYIGGAHGIPSEALNTFECKTGKMLVWEDLVTDINAVQALAEKKVREVRADVFEGGFNFDETFQFVLPVNYGLTKEGIFLYYTPYEIMPYAMGETEVTLTFEELGALSKIRI